jgi:hypothetical protein
MFFLPTMVMPDSPGTNNDGPGDPDGTRRRIQAHVLNASAFGLAAGLTCALLFLLFNRVPGIAPGVLAEFFADILNLFKVFLYGLVFGTFVAVVYNGLVAHHFNIFNTDAEDFA